MTKWTTKDMAYRPGGLSEPDLAQVGEVGIWGERQWQGLTDEEYTMLIQQADHDAAKTGSVFQNLRHAIEAKLKEKNGFA